MEQQACFDQSDVFAFLADPATHELREPIIRIDTHGAAVFLAGKNVYKVKRAVRFPFMDFSTLDKRRRACERELAVNEADAPGLYLGVVPISKDGFHLKFGGGGTIVEWAVHLRRFDENRTLDRLVKRNELNLEIIAKLAGVVAASHRRAPIIGGANAGQALQRQIEETLISLEAAPRIFAAQAVAGLRHAMQQAFARLAPLLSERENQGQVRRCHGDLHLRNIVLIEDRPVLFDAIEFDEAIATCDVLYDLAFLLMDLWTRGLRSHANLLFNRYLWICDDVERQLKSLSASAFPFLACRNSRQGDHSSTRKRRGSCKRRAPSFRSRLRPSFSAPARFGCHRRSVRDRQELACRRALQFDRTRARRRASAERH
jgi:aminoglycoside phosphotransferase family enzyme